MIIEGTSSVGIDDDHPQQVGNDVTQDDPRRPDTHGHRGLDVLPVPDAERLPADDPGHVEPAYEADADDSIRIERPKTTMNRISTNM